jgi:hypothetical protein
VDREVKVKEEKKEKGTQVSIGFPPKLFKFLFPIFIHATRHATFQWAIVLSFTQSQRSHNGAVTDTLPAKVWVKYHSEAKFFDPSTPA